MLLFECRGEIPSSVSDMVRSIAPQSGFKMVDDGGMTSILKRCLADADWPRKMVVCTGLAPLNSTFTNPIFSHKPSDVVRGKWKLVADLGTSPWKDGIEVLDIELERMKNFSFVTALVRFRGVVAALPEGVAGHCVQGYINVASRTDRPGPRSHRYPWQRFGAHWTLKCKLELIPGCGCRREPNHGCDLELLRQGWPCPRIPRPMLMDWSHFFVCGYEDDSLGSLLPPYLTSVDITAAAVNAVYEAQEDTPGAWTT